jgi:hypothetical protein
VAKDDAIDTGGETVYEVRVANRASTPCRGLRVTAQIGDGLQVMQAEGVTAAIVQQRTVPFDPLPELPARTEALYRVRLRGSKVGEWRIGFRVEADGVPQPTEKELLLRVSPAEAKSAPER